MASNVHLNAEQTAMWEDKTNSFRQDFTEELTKRCLKHNDKVAVYAVEGYILLIIDHTNRSISN